MSLFHVEKLSKIHGLYIQYFVFVIVEECAVFFYII